MSIDANAEIERLINEIKDNQINSADGITKLASLLGVFEKKNNAIYDFSINSLDITKPFVLNLIEENRTLNEHHNNLNRILVLQAVGVSFNEKEIYTLLAKTRLSSF